MTLSKKRLTVGSLRTIAKENRPPNVNQSFAPLKHGQQQASRKMRTQTLIKIEQHDRTFTLIPFSGITMLDAALSQNQPIDYKCRKGNCGKCKVRVLEGSALLSSPTSKELSTLKKELAEGYRLACQTTIN